MPPLRGLGTTRLSPGIKPEDILPEIGIEGPRAGGELGLDILADHTEEKAKKLARQKKMGTAAKSRIARTQSDMLRHGGHVFVGIGYLFAAQESVKNWKECQAGKDPE